MVASQTSQTLLLLLTIDGKKKRELTIPNLTISGTATSQTIILLGGQLFMFVSLCQSPWLCCVNC